MLAGSLLAGLQGCNVDTIAKHVMQDGGGLHGPNAAVGGVNYRVDGEANTAALDEHITRCAVKDKTWTFLAGSKPVLTLTGEPVESVRIETNDGTVQFARSSCAPVKLDVNTASGDGGLKAVCDQGREHLVAGLRFAGCKP